MSLNSILQFLVPKDKKFFPLFHQHAQILVDMATTLHEAVNVKQEERDPFFNKLGELEEESEKLMANVNFELSKNFLTPFDREDIYALTSKMNEVTDFLDGSASRMRLYQVDKVKKSIRKITEANLEACLQIQKAIKALEGFKDLKTVLKCCEKINKLENKVDNIYDKEIYEIFDEYENVKDIIKYKEVFSALENTTDKCKYVADVLEGISVKHS
jgi:predicted phosphate transport protein (TIGR00153 family)